MTQQSFCMQNDLADVDPMVVSLKTLARNFLPQNELSKFEICTSEALTNLVAHAATTDTAAPICMTLTNTAGALVLDIFDPEGAAAFDPRNHAPALDDVDPLAESGRGLALIMQCADAVDYGPVKNRMRLSLTFLKSGD